MSEQQPPSPPVLAQPASLPTPLSDSARQVIERLMAEERKRLQVDLGPGGAQGEFLYIFRPGMAVGAYGRIGWRGQRDWGARFRWEF